MSEPEAVKMVFACGPGMCDMDAGSIATEEGVKIFTGGAEGMLKVFDPQDLETAVKEMNLDELDEGDDGLCVTAVAVSPGGEEVALGLRNGDVKLYDLPSLEFRSNLTRFTAPVLGLHYGMKDGGVIAACSEEPGIRIIRRGNNNHTLKLDDHDGGVKSVKWDPKGEFLAAAGFDGTVKVWSVDPALEEMTTEVVSSANYFSKEAVGLGESGSEGFSHLGKIAWHPEGKSLSVTGGTDPLMLARGDWKRSMIVPEDVAQGGHTSEITVSSFSPDGRYLATAALDGRVVLWDTKEKEAVKTFVNTANENWRDLQWLDGSTVAALSTGGSLCTLQNVPPPTAKATNSAVDTAVGGDKTSKKSTSKNKGKEGVPQEEDVGGGGGERAKRLFDSEAVEDNGGEVSEADTSPIDDDDDDVAAAAVDVGEGDVTVNLDGAGGLAEGDGSGGGGGGTGDGTEDILGMIPTTPAVGAPQFQVETTPMQDPFQPSSTPLGDARRYLCWNRVGTILSVDENTHNDVEIEFADKSAGRNQRFMDTWNFVMGSLSSTGAVFASVAQGEEDEEGGSAGPSPSGGRSVLYYKTLGRRSTGEEWTRMMPKGENVLGVAVGRGWAAAATDRQLLRLFTASGLQGETIMLPGPIVTMAGGGDVLAVVFHQGEPQGDSQKLGYQVLDVGGKRELSKGDLCLSPGSELTWLSTSEEGMVVSMDSAGLVSGLTLSFGWQWSPLLDTLKVSKNKKDRFWPVGLVTGKLLAATLKSGEEHPTAYPRPVLTSVPLSALCAKSRDGEEMASFEKTFPQLEARARQRRFNLDNGLTEDDGGGGANAEEMEGVLMSQHAQLDTMVVKRIQQACADENPERAMDLASLLNLEKSFTIAIKVANHHGLTSLAANMDDAMIAKFRSEEEEHDEDDSSDNEELMGGGRHSSGGNRGGGGNDNLGPLDRARLLQSKRPRAKSNNNDNDENGGGLTLDNALPVDSDVEELDSSGEGGGGDGGKKTLKRRSVGRERGAEGDSEEEGEGGGVEEEEEEEEEAELAAPAATVPRNPFARGATFSSPPRKKRKDVMETMHDLKSSPSPTAASKRTPLSRLSSFSTEARTKKRNDRNIL